VIDILKSLGIHAVKLNELNYLNEISSLTEKSKGRILIMNMVLPQSLMSWLINNDTQKIV
jgi:hypothetical protein